MESPETVREVAPEPTPEVKTPLNILSHGGACSSMTFKECTNAG